MKDMHDNIKRDRILGLVVGLMGEFLENIARTMARRSLAEDIAHNGWAILQLIYIALVWFYRGRIGHWTIKIVQSVYKKV